MKTIEVDMINALTTKLVNKDKHWPISEEDLGFFYFLRDKR